MIISIASSKGGVGKTVTAMTLAAYFNTLDPTLLLDGDKTRNAVAWAKRGGDAFPFRVAPAEHAAKLAHQFTHVVIDTGQGPSNDDLATAAEMGQLLIIPAVPAGTNTDGLRLTIEALQTLGVTNFRVLLTQVAPDAAREALELREALAHLGVPMFATEIPRLKAFNKAAVKGLIVNAVDDKNASRAWGYYAAVGKEILACLSPNSSAV